MNLLPGQQRSGDGYYVHCTNDGCDLPSPNRMTSAGRTVQFNQVSQYQSTPPEIIFNPQIGGYSILSPFWEVVEMFSNYEK
jgi:hypothetical protein